MSQELLITAFDKKLGNKFPVVESKKNIIVNLGSKEFNEIRRIKVLTNRDFDICKYIWYRTETIKEAVTLIRKIF